MHLYLWGGETFVGPRPFPVPSPDSASLQSEQCNAQTTCAALSPGHLWRCTTGSEWYVPSHRSPTAGAPEGQTTWPEKSHNAFIDYYYYWLLQLQAVRVGSNIETLSMHMNINSLSNTPWLQSCKKTFVTPHCLPVFSEVRLRGYGQLHCNIDNSIEHTGIFLFSTMCIITAVTNVHLLSNTEPAEHSVCACSGRNHIRTSEEAAVPELDLWPTSNAEVFLRGRPCVCVCGSSSLTSFSLLNSPKYHMRI